MNCTCIIIHGATIKKNSCIFPLFLLSKHVAVSKQKVDVLDGVVIGVFLNNSLAWQMLADDVHLKQFAIPNS